MNTNNNNFNGQIPFIPNKYIFKIKATGSPLKYAQHIANTLQDPSVKEIELAAVGQAITNLMLTSSILADYLEFLHRSNNFSFKPCEYCTPADAVFNDD